MKNQPININGQEALASNPLKARALGMPKKQKKRALKTAKTINEYYIAFKLVKDPKDCLSYILKIDKINDLLEFEEMEQNNIEQLPKTGLLEQWKVEVRERPNGMQDKLYFHPKSSRTLRSLVEVSKFIQDNYDPNRSESLQVRVQLSNKCSSSEKEKNKGGSRGKKKKRFQDAAHKERVKKPSVQDIYGQTHANLRNMFPSAATHETKTTGTQNVVELFLQANCNLLNSSKSFQSSSNTIHNSFEEETPEAIKEIIEELFNNSFEDESPEAISQMIVELLHNSVEDEAISEMIEELLPNSFKDESPEAISEMIEELLHNSFEEESPEAISEMIEELLHKEESPEAISEMIEELLHNSFEEESPEAISEMIEELLHNSFEEESLEGISEMIEEILHNSFQDEGPEAINVMIAELLDEENAIFFNVDVQSNVYQDKAEDEIQVVKIVADDLGKDVNANAKVEPAKTSSENWLQRMLADLDNKK